MWNPDYSFAVPSFAEPIEDPGTAPESGPWVCIRLSKTWQKILAGCALQVCQPPSWDLSDPDALADVLARSEDLLWLIATAEDCVPTQHGHVDITIAAGDGTHSAAITFGTAFLSTPDVVVSCNDVALAATWSSVSTSGVSVHLTAAIPVIVDTTATVTWAALA